MSVRFFLLARSSRIPFPPLPLICRSRLGKIKIEGYPKRGGLQGFGLASFLVLAALLVLWAPLDRGPKGLSWEGYDSRRFP